MAIEKESLDAIARAYVDAMPSIRGRRVHRLLMREFARYDHVLPALAENGSAALLALADDGSVAVCRTDGKGPAAGIAEWSRLESATVTTAYDLTKDSLPIVGWTITHPSFARAAGALSISSSGIAKEDQARIADVLRRLGR
jgi:hypothetical protein